MIELEIKHKIGSLLAEMNPTQRKYCLGEEAYKKFPRDTLRMKFGVAPHPEHSFVAAVEVSINAAPEYSMSICAAGADKMDAYKNLITAVETFLREAIN